jgi:KaiC/GvpD/RAD55 family RecA-like ATPase
VKLKDAALIYIEAGFSIIPLHWIAKNKCSCGRGDCASPAKHPVTQHGLKDASNNPDQVKAWWKQYPKANIGVCTGQASNGLTVIDFDLQKFDLQKGTDSIPLGLPVTLEVATGNGFHLWFKSDQEIRNSAGKLGQGIDVRGWGGYVVAPPSIHHSGRIYTFANQNSILDFPPEILAKLQPEPEDPDLVLSYSSDMADFAPEGSRNDFLTKIGGKLRRQGFSPPEIESTLLATNLQRCSPPLADKEVRQIARSVGRYIPAQQIETQIEDKPELTLPDDELDDIPNLDQSQADQDSQPDLPPNPFPTPPGRDPLLGAITLEQLNLTIFGRPEMILQGLSKGDWGLVVGIGSVGKTTFLHNIAVCLATGRPFPPLIPEGQTPRKILYLDFESNPWRLQSQLRILQEVLTDEEKILVGKNLHFAIEPEINGTPWRLTDIPSLLNLAKYIQKHQIDLVVVDTLAQAASLSDENNNAEVQRKVVTPIRRLVKHCDVAVLLLHHEGKGKMQTGENYTQYKARGASSLIDAARYQITITPADKEKKGQVEVVNSKDKGEGFRAVIMELDQKSRWFSMLGYLNKTLKASDVIMETLEKQTGEVSLDELSTLIPTIAKSTIKNNLTELVKSNRITRTEHGSYCINNGSQNGTTALAP